MAQLTLRALSIGEILDLAFTLYRRQFVTLLSIAVITTGFPLVMQVYILSAGGYFYHVALTLVYVLLSVVMSALATAATVFVVSESYLGRALDVGAAFGRAIPLIGTVILTSLALSFLVGLGLILLLVPGIILACGLGLAFVVVVVERTTTGEALSRSWALTTGYKGKMFLLFLAVWLIIMLPALTLGVIAGLLAGDAVAGGDPSSGVLAAVVGGLAQIVVYPLLYCSMTVAYYDLRVRKEAFDLEVLESALQRVGA